MLRIRQSAAFLWLACGKGGPVCTRDRQAIGDFRKYNPPFLRRSRLRQPMTELDVITIGRSSVDLYGRQVGGRLEDMLSFAKYVGGSPTNMAVGAARLGLRAGVVTRVGDEHFGRFIRETLEGEGVDTRTVRTDPERLTALAILGIRDRDSFPLIFYRENCADMALSESDIDPAAISRAGCVVTTGTHHSHEGTDAACRRALRLARGNGARTALDIDYRPNLWGLGGHGAGEDRYQASGRVAQRLQEVMPLCDLVVGTEEELRAAGGAEDLMDAIRSIRACTEAAIVCKRGPTGAVLFEGGIPGTVDEGLQAPGFPIEVFNVLGAGDGFMAGLLRGWLRGEPWLEALRFANACGALAVSRHGCAPAYPSWEELVRFIEHGSSERAVRKDTELAHLHRATTRWREWPTVRAFAFDHRSQMREMAARAGAGLDRVGAFKHLCLRAALEVADGAPGFGVLCDGSLGQEALHAAAGSGLWIGRPVERPGSRPLALEIGPDIGSDLVEWPREHVVKCLCNCHPDDPDEMWDGQIRTLLRLQDAVIRAGLEWLLETLPSAVAEAHSGSTAMVMERLYGAGLRPDWWKLEPMSDSKHWEEACAMIETFDPHCRGIVVLGRDAPMDTLAETFRIAAVHERVRGFAVGRTVFGAVLERWLGGAIGDDGAIAEMAKRYRGLAGTWDAARRGGGR